MKALKKKADREWQKVIVRRYGNRCKSCSSTNRVCGHHILTKASRPDLRWNMDNGIALCFVCHATVHALPKGEVINLYEIIDRRAYEWLKNPPKPNNKPMFTDELRQIIEGLKNE